MTINSTEIVFKTLFISAFIKKVSSQITNTSNIKVKGVNGDKSPRNWLENVQTHWPLSSRTCEGQMRSQKMRMANTVPIFKKR